MKRKTALGGFPFHAFEYVCDLQSKQNQVLKKDFIITAAGRNDETRESQQYQPWEAADTAVILNARLVFNYKMQFIFRASAVNVDRSGALYSMQIHKPLPISYSNL